MPSSLRRSLLATLAYFDLFDHPLTLAELRRYRYRFPDEAEGLAGGRPSEALAKEGPPALADMLTALAAGSAGVSDGYWHLPGRAAIVGTRQRRYRLAEPKFRKARTVAGLLRFLPSVRLVAVCNSLAISNADGRSDIDLFVIVRPRLLWATRLITVGVLAALGLRPKGESHADKVCMSFFVSERGLDLSRVAAGPDDVYLRYWIASLVPIYDARGDAGGVFADFLEENAWVADRVPGALAARRDRADAPPRWIAAFLPLLRRLEPAAKRLQMRRFPREIRGLANLDSRVVVSDDMLKFHVTDRREEYARRFRERLDDLGISGRSVVQPVEGRKPSAFCRQRS